MFDIGFWELCLLGLVGLLVVGPEKLPEVIRLVGFWINKIKDMLSVVTTEIKAELQAEEIRQLLKQQTGTKKAQQLLKAGSNTIDEIKTSVQSLGDIDKLK